MTSHSASASKHGPRAAARGTGMLGKSVRTVLAGHRVGERPPQALPALAVLGRSNVGKSSLLNAVLGVKVAKVSQTPGRTQALYWYRVDERFDVVDCPGYGYAKAAKEARALFSEMIEALLLGDPHPAALLLVDGRLEPQESDRSMALFLEESGIRTVVAATKWDAVKPSQRVKRLRELTREYARDGRPLQTVSSETGEGLAALARLLRTSLSSSSSSAPPDQGEPDEPIPTVRRPEETPAKES